MEIKRVNRNLNEFQKIAELYEISFPEHERMPFRLLMLFSRRKCAKFLAFYSDGQFVGFTYLITVKAATFVFYLAIDPAQRSKSYGSQILNEIAALHDGNMLALNIETVVPEAENYAERVRRQQFYFKNGFLDSGYRMEDTPTAYDILYKGKRFAETDYKNIFKFFSFGLVNVKITKK